MSSPACPIAVCALALPVASPVALPLPLSGALLRAGFPSPAEDYIEGRLDLNELLIRHPAATFFARVKGASMEGARIYDGDLLVVDRAITPADRQIVVAAVDGELTVKRYRRIGARVWLDAASPLFAPIELRDGQELQVCGVVIASIRQF